MFIQSYDDNYTTTFNDFVGHSLESRLIKVNLPFFKFKKMINNIKDDLKKEKSGKHLFITDDIGVFCSFNSVLKKIHIISLVKNYTSNSYDFRHKLKEI